MEHKFLSSHCESCDYWMGYSIYGPTCGYITFFNKQCPHVTQEDVSYKYSYEGPVMIFDDCVDTKWKGETIAISENKARSNLMHRYKTEKGYALNTKVTLPGQLKIINEYRKGE